MDPDIRVAGPTDENQVMDRAWMPGTEIGAVVGSGDESGGVRREGRLVVTRSRGRRPPARARQDSTSAASAPLMIASVCGALASARAAAPRTSALEPSSPATTETCRAAEGSA
jgi:hypothetical protein